MDEIHIRSASERHGKSQKQTTTSRHDFKVNTNTTRIYDIANKQICLLRSLKYYKDSTHHCQEHIL